MLFNKVLGENEKCAFYFYLKTEGTFWPTQYLLFLIYFLNKFIYFILFILGCIRSLLLRAFCSSCGERELLFIVVRGPLMVVASLAVEHEL